MILSLVLFYNNSLGCLGCVYECVTCSPAGVKEIDIAATLEHVRDQRPGMVRTKVSHTVNFI